jgi:Glycosyltransferase family 87
MNSTLADSGNVRRSGLGAAFRRLAPVVVFVVLPGLLLTAAIVHSLGSSTPDRAFFDFHAFWNAGKDVLHGRSPYPPADPGVLAHERSFVYPAPAAVAMAPFALLPFKVSATIFALLIVASVPAALWIVGVRDWRCFGIALLSQPVTSSVLLDAVSGLLAVGLAVAWRCRDRALPAAVALAFVIVLKVFLWPFLLWFAFTRRLRVAVVAVGLIAAVTLASWAIVGLDSLRSYPHLLRVLTSLLEGKGYSLVALGLALGASSEAARAAAFGIGAAALALVALRGRRAGADEWGFAVTLGAAYALSPIVWPHYFILLFVPIAIARPSLSWLWALPLPLWIVGAESTYPPIWRSANIDRDPALSPRIGHLPLIAYAVTIVVLTLSLAAYRSAGRDGEP